MYGSSDCLYKKNKFAFICEVIWNLFVKRMKSEPRVLNVCSCYCLLVVIVGASGGVFRSLNCFIFYYCSLFNVHLPHQMWILLNSFLSYSSFNCLIMCWLVISIIYIPSTNIFVGSKLFCNWSPVYYSHWWRVHKMQIFLVQPFKDTKMHW